MHRARAQECDSKPHFHLSVHATFALCACLRHTEQWLDPPPGHSTRPSDLLADGQLVGEARENVACAEQVGLTVVLSHLVLFSTAFH